MAMWCSHADGPTNMDITMRILLVRHGQSEWNAVHRLQGQADAELSDLGRTQARGLRDDIAGLEPDRWLTSDLKRVVETSELIGGESVERLESLREFGLGEWEGRYVDDVMAEDADAYHRWRAGEIVPPGGEPRETFLARIREPIDALIDSDAERIVVACHGGVIRGLLEVYLGLTPDRLLPAANASLTIVEFDRSTRRARLQVYNYRPSLDSLTNDGE